jgi:hypothetical protein
MAVATTILGLTAILAMMFGEDISDLITRKGDLEKLVKEAERRMQKMAYSREAMAEHRMSRLAPDVQKAAELSIPSKGTIGVVENELMAIQDTAMELADKQFLEEGQIAGAAKGMMMDPYAGLDPEEREAVEAMMARPPAGDLVGTAAEAETQAIRDAVASGQLLPDDYLDRIRRA